MKCLIKILEPEQERGGYVRALKKNRIDRCIGVAFENGPQVRFKGLYVQTHFISCDLDAEHTRSFEILVQSAEGLAQGCAREIFGAAAPE